MNTFVESQFELMSVYEFQTKANSHEHILLSLSSKLCKFMSFKINHILMKTFVESQFEVM